MDDEKLVRELEAVQLAVINLQKSMVRWGFTRMVDSQSSKMISQSRQLDKVVAHLDEVVAHLDELAIVIPEIMNGNC